MPDNALLPYMRRALDQHSKKLALTSEALGAAALYVAIVRDQEQATDAETARRLIHELHLAQRDITNLIQRLTNLTETAQQTTEV